MVLRIDIVSDVVCPWCIIGFRQLETALQDRGQQAEITWHPFELNPTMPPAGQDLRAHIQEKYGTTRDASDKARARLTTMGAALGFTFRYDDRSRMLNTFQAHQLLYWALDYGRQHALKLALFTAYFTDQRDISNPTILADVASAVGLDRAEAEAVLLDARFGPDVRDEQQFWTRNGITGVPAMVFARRHLVVGAQGTDNYGLIIDQLTAQDAA